MKEKRFKEIYQQGITNCVEIWVDTETGVNYMYRRFSDAGGLTPLLNADGSVVVTKE